MCKILLILSYNEWESLVARGVIDNAGTAAFGLILQKKLFPTTAKNDNFSSLEVINVI